MNVPENLKYTDDHEWIKVDGDTALIGVNQEIRKLQNQFVADGQALHTVHCWSDRGEFSCTAFIHGLSLLSHKLHVNIHWRFGEPEHGKNKV